MTIQEAYKRFLLKVNKNDSQADVRIPEPLFVLLFNEQSTIWFAETIERSLASDSIDDLEQFIETSELELDVVKQNESYFILPIDFYKYITSQVVASNGGCTKNLYIYKFKPKNKNIYLQDEFTKPSFEWEETLLSLTSKKAIVYTDNFTVEKLVLEYYKLPDPVDIEGYVNVDGQSSRTIHPTLSDEFVNQIINRCASEFAKMTENPDSFQLSETRLIKEK